MRILHVIARLNVGGTSRYLETLSQGLTTAGVENAIATGYVQDGEIEDECVARLPILRVKHLGRAISPLNDLRARQELKKIISDFNPDVIHTHTFKAGMIGRSIPFGGRRVHTYHGHIFNDGSLTSMQRTVAIFLERILSFRTDNLISVGEKVSNELKSLGIARERNWNCIYPAVTIFELVPRAVAAKRLKVNEGVKTVGWLGRLVDVKDPQLVLEIARHLPAIQFVVAGGGPLEESLAVRRPENVHLVGYVSKEHLLSVSDVLLITSRSEGMPLAAIEAQMAGIPVVAPNVGSLSETLLKENSILTSSRDVDSLKNGLLQFLEGKIERTESSKLPLQTIATKFSIEVQVQSHIQIYKSKTNT